MAFKLPALPFAEDALAPHMSADTLRFHHGKHHNAYVNTLNDLIKDTPFADMELEQIIRKTAGDADKRKMFNQAAQVWNHTFFWKSLSPAGGGEPPADVKDKLTSAFGSVGDFKTQFKQVATGQFGSGWAWLYADAGGALKITGTPNAETPVQDGLKPILTCDVWEHAYYLDYQNRRPDFVQTFLDELLNWEFIAENLKADGDEVAQKISALAA